MEGDSEQVYRAWYKSQSPAKRAELDSKGLSPDKYELPFLKVNGQSCIPVQEEQWIDPNVASEEPPSNDHSVTVLIHKLIDAFSMFESKDCQLQAECIKIVTGIGNPMSQVKLAKRYGLTRAGVSWRVKKIQAMLGTKPSIYMRSEDVCRVYATLPRKKPKPTS